MFVHLDGEDFGLFADDVPESTIMQGMVRPISQKKPSYPVSEAFRDYLREYGRETQLPVVYGDLMRYTDSMPLLDRNQNDTLWETTIYNEHLRDELNRGLTMIYSLLRTSGDISVMEHLYVERIDYCTFGNSNPFRVVIINKYNDNRDYFYVKKADASRIYGLELEHILSPNRIGFLVHGDTLIEEHIAGVPGDVFVKNHLLRKDINRVRIAKEFTKFNERCFVRLLGDMRSYNWVVDITPDFEEEQYRIRVIDFDQQSYEGRRVIYLPQFFQDNQQVVKLCANLLNYEAIKQYQYEERSLIARRFKSSYEKIMHLLSCMRDDELSTLPKIAQLRGELAKCHQDSRFLRCKTMGDLVYMNLKRALRNFEVF